MNIKDVVFQDYQGIRRYGVVKKKYMIERWAHVEVDWVNDAENQPRQRSSDTQGLYTTR